MSQSRRTFAAALATLAFGCGGGGANDQSTLDVAPTSQVTPTTGSTASTQPASTTSSATGAAMQTAGQADTATTTSTASAGSAAPTTATTATTTTVATTGAAGAAPADDAAAAAAGAPAVSDMMAAAGSDAAAMDSTMPASSVGKLPRVDTTDGPGPYSEVVKVMNTPPGGWLIYPKEIGKDGIKHPLFVFGPGGGTTPSTYEQQGHWDRYGSYGLVIYVLPQSTGDGSAMKAGLDWLISQNDDSSSPLYQNLDTTKVCASGHSMGSVTTFDFMPDDRVTTTIHISGGSFDHQGPKNLKADTMFLCGPDSGADMAVPQCDGDFETSTVPTFYTKIQGSTHITSGRLGWESIIAWMLWHLADQEDQWKKEFIEPTGKFQTGVYKSQIKNW